jgi:hypothetical protein
LSSPQFLDQTAVVRRVGVEHHLLDHRAELVDLGGREALHQAEVEERDVAAWTEQVIARVRIAVEDAELVQAAEHEAVDGLGGQVLLAL